MYGLVQFECPPVACLPVGTDSQNGTVKRPIARNYMCYLPLTRNLANASKNALCFLSLTDLVSRKYQCCLPLTSIRQNPPKMALCFLPLTDTLSRKYQCCLPLTKKGGGGSRADTLVGFHKRPITGVSRRSETTEPTGVSALPMRSEGGFVGLGFSRAGVLGLSLINFRQNQRPAHLKVSPTNANSSGYGITQSESMAYGDDYFHLFWLDPFTWGGGCAMMGMLCCSVVALDLKTQAAGHVPGGFFCLRPKYPSQWGDGSRIKLH
jgi:hypothetical protein